MFQPTCFEDLEARKVGVTWSNFSCLVFVCLLCLYSLFKALHSGEPCVARKFAHPGLLHKQIPGEKWRKAYNHGMGYARPKSNIMVSYSMLFWWI